MTAERLRPNAHGTIDLADVRAGIPASQVHLRRLPSTRAVLSDAGVRANQVFAGWGRFGPEYAGWVLDADWASKLEARKRARATAEKPELSSEDAARRAARTEQARVTRQLRKLADAGDPYATVLRHLRAAQRASDSAKLRAASGLHRDEYAGTDTAYRASRLAVAKDYLHKTWELETAVKNLPATTLTWGWGTDPESIPPHVLYVDLPTGQVSFHMEMRGDGPHYNTEWDGVRGVSGARIEDAIRALVAS